MGYRINKEKADWLIYCVDIGQTQNFNIKKIKIDHIAFGLVLRNDGKKFKTREGEHRKLLDLLKYAVKKSFLQIKERKMELKGEKINKLSSILGINAVKYNDLCCMRTKNYKFCYSNMLKFEGNTAIFLCY